MSKRPSTYHAQYRKLRKEVHDWLRGDDDPAFASRFQQLGERD